MTATKESTEESNSEVLEVFSSDAGEWKSLLVGASDDEQQEASRLASIEGLRVELGHVVESENLVVLAGLGTSLGIPASNGKAAPKMSDLWAAASALPSFTAVRDTLSKEVVDSANLEHVLSEAQAREALAADDSALGKFISEAEEIVWERCTFVEPQTPVTSHETFLRKVARRSTRLQRTQVFTTNYDLAFEVAARNARFNVIDGFGYNDSRDFDGSSFDLDFVRHRPGEQLSLEPNVFHLLKLHGSVDWDGSEDKVRKVQGKPGNPVLIYPSVAKFQLSYRQPYLEFMSRFQMALRESDVGLVVAGFGFNDEHLVAPIEAAIRSNIGLRVVVVNPAIRQEGRSPALSWMQELAELGDRRITLINGTFDDLVRLLPDVPRQEERDAHADRIGRPRAADGRR